MHAGPTSEHRRNFCIESQIYSLGKEKMSYYEEIIVRILSIKGIKSVIRFVIEVCSDAEKLIKFVETNDFVLF